MRHSLLLIIALAARGAMASDGFPAFRELVVDSDVGKVCYAVTVADVNNDGMEDIVAVTENRVVWYEAPDWQIHVIIDSQTPLDNVCIAPHDIDGDGLIDFALGAGWTKRGTLHWINRGDDPTELWSVHSIGEELWTHRMRWADVLGKGSSQLVVSPLNAGNDAAGVRLLAFEIPRDPATDRWPSTTLNGELNRMHNHWHVDLNNDDLVDTLTASREGVSLVRRSGNDWVRDALATGAAAETPNQRGAGEIKLGTLKNGPRFITTVEPMHGHSVVVYLESSDKNKGWTRHVIDTGFQRGHALWTADIDGDDSDEIAFGHSDTPDTFGIIVYDCTSDDGTQWAKHVLDAGGIATEDLVVHDFNGDGRPDIVAGGRATHNIKLYLNQP
jgi:Aldos-2-ulose dehydratase, beta-propeller domain/FG-GAP-like repeat